MNIAVILAGGIGARVGGTTPKQLLPLADGKSILEHSVEAFEQAACIGEIGIVMHKDYLAQAQEVVHRNAWHKVAFVIAGGNERYESSLNAIHHIQKTFADKIDSANINILLHDAARPFVSERIIMDVCTALQQHEAVTVAIPATDTMYRVALQEQNATGDLVVQDIPPRSTLLCAQTPQAFRLTTIAEAYRQALQPQQESNGRQFRTLQATDDCSILYQYLPHIPIHIVPGDAQNRKITYKEDL